MRGWLKSSVVGSIVVAWLALAAGPASATTYRSSEDATGGVFACQGATYTVTSGTIDTVIHEGSSSSGNENFTGTVTTDSVRLIDAAGNAYRLRGAVSFGATANDQQQSGIKRFTIRLTIVGESGVAERIAIAGHFSSDGSGFFMDKGTCAEPH